MMVTTDDTAKYVIKRPTTYVLCIDPGLGGSGYAVFRAKDFYVNSVLAIPVLSKAKKLKDTEAYLQYLEDLLNKYNIVKVYCEGQALMQNSAVGDVTATSGALVKLANFAGAIHGLCYGSGVAFEYIAVITWKGQLSKEVCKRRIRKVWPKVTCTTHDYDAVGIGFFIQGAINRKYKQKFNKVR